MKRLKQLMLLGTQDMVKSNAEKLKITNLVALVTCVIASLYTSYFYFVLGQNKLTLLNIGFVFSYGITLYLSAKGFVCAAKSWFLSVLMVHIFILTLVVFTPAAGFHFYYLLLPPGVLLLFEDKDNLAKNTLMFTGVVLFFICDLLGNSSPLIALTADAEKALFLSTIFVVMVEVYFIMLIFSRAIARNEARLQELATLDVLTGVKNRRSFIELGEALIARTQRYQRPLTLLLFDVDHFKRINDTHGHLIGDKALKIIAQTLEKNLRSSDTIARYGGEEFVVLLPETKSGEAIKLANHLIDKIQQVNINIDQDTSIHCTVSIGLAEFNEATPSLMALVHCADIALYQAKKLGRNQVVTYTDRFEDSIKTC
ncbi:GGDEF domain-containing protein [Litorilituus sediminis]|nr:GGDEF domain-containing protein [Litorilituus sediminis]